MNRFILEANHKDIALSHCNKHIVKMPLEEAQMLCTAHRILDGKLETRPSKSGKRQVKYWALDDSREDVLYKPVHMNHPCTKWSMETRGNYLWAYQLFTAMLDEYTYRYKKVHLCDTKLRKVLCNPPHNIGTDMSLTPHPLAMGSNPDCIDHDDVIGSYRKYYKSKQERFDMVWSPRPVPSWW